MKSWKDLVWEKIRYIGDKDEDIVIDIFSCKREDFERPFDNLYRGEDGGPFVAWTKDYIYFSVIEGFREHGGTCTHAKVSVLPRNPKMRTASMHRYGTVTADNS